MAKTRTLKAGDCAYDMVNREMVTIIHVDDETDGFTNYKLAYVKYPHLGSFFVGYERLRKLTRKEMLQFKLAPGSLSRDDE